MRKKGNSVKHENITLYINTSKESTLDTCLKYIGAKPPQNKNAKITMIIQNFLVL